jgi:hypothetical protein
MLMTIAGMAPKRWSATGRHIHRRSPRRGADLATVRDTLGHASIRDDQPIYTPDPKSSGDYLAL